MSLFSLFNFGNSEIKNALRKGAVVIDVRTAYEFDQGRVPGSINIPVDRIPVNIPRIKGMNRPVILCASYYEHSSTATKILKESGLNEVYNGGKWESVLKIYNKL
ncbi:MAG: rhodanese-like domain-containing protein [Bacteroidia bacterium]|nr:rhodanese-like domain-containing protein [Bacteroidia bacterium]